MRWDRTSLCSQSCYLRAECVDVSTRRTQFHVKPSSDGGSSVVPHFLSHALAGYPLHIDPPAVKAEAFHVEPSDPDEAVQTEVYSGLDPSRFGEQALVSSQAEDNASAAFSERSRHPTDGSGASLPLYQGTNWFSPPAHHSPTSGSTTTGDSRVPTQLPDHHLGTPQRQHNDASGYMKQVVLFSAEMSVRTTTARRLVSSQTSIPAAVSAIDPRRPWFHVEQRSK